MKRIAISGLTLLFACGCASSAKMSSDEAQAKFGPSPANFKEDIKSAMKATLKDPYSAVYEFDQPVKAKEWRGLINGGGSNYGWAVTFTVNAKNSFGGYVGAESYQAMFTDGIVRVYTKEKSGITILTN